MSLFILRRDLRKLELRVAELEAAAVKPTPVPTPAPKPVAKPVPAPRPVPKPIPAKPVEPNKS